MKYEKAMAEVVEFDNSDVVTASFPGLLICAFDEAATDPQLCFGNVIGLGDPGETDGPGAGSW